jgi:hypothetical protein
MCVHVFVSVCVLMRTRAHVCVCVCVYVRVCQVPAYLVERKLQMAEERRALEAAREAAKVPPGGQAGAGRRSGGMLHVEAREASASALGRATAAQARALVCRALGAP